MKIPVHICSAALVVSLSSSPLRAIADTITLNDGRQVSGQISAETATAVTIEAPNGRFTFARDKIQAVKRESPFQNELRQMEKFLSQGNLDAALTFYRSSTLSSNLSTGQLHSTMLQTLEPVAIGITATSGTAVALADTLTHIEEASAELLLLAAVVSMDSGNNELALSLLRRIGENVPAHLNWKSKTVSLLLERASNRALESKNGTFLAAVTELAGKLPLTASTSTSEQLVVYANIKARFGEKKFFNATALFKPDLFLHRADLFVPLAEQLMAAIYSAPESAETMAALQNARTSIFPYIDKQVATRGMKLIINRLITADRTNAAQQVVDDTAVADADTGALLQHLLDFQLRKKDLPNDSSPMERYKLAAWARRMGLFDESKALFIPLRSDPRFAETVNMQLTLIEHAQAEETVATLRRLFDENEFEQLKLASSRFLSTSPPENFAKQARDLVQLADFQSWSSQRSSFGKAEAEFQQAERLVNRQEYDQALMHLNRIQLDQENSAAAAKAQALRDKIMLQKLREVRRAPAGANAQ